jgi:flagellar protein FliT
LNSKGHNVQQQTLLDYYKAIEGASQRMLLAAQREDWEQVMQLEGACAVLIEQLHHQSQLEPWPAKTAAKRARSCCASCATTP